MKEMEQQACIEGCWSQNPELEPEPETVQKVGTLPPATPYLYPLLSTKIHTHDQSLSPTLSDPFWAYWVFPIKHIMSQVSVVISVPPSPSPPAPHCKK